MNHLNDNDSLVGLGQTKNILVTKNLTNSDKEEILKILLIIRTS